MNRSARRVLLRLFLLASPLFVLTFVATCLLSQHVDLIHGPSSANGLTSECKWYLIFCRALFFGMTDQILSYPFQSLHPKNRRRRFESFPSSARTQPHSTERELWRKDAIEWSFKCLCTCVFFFLSLFLLMVAYWSTPPQFLANF